MKTPEPQVGEIVTVDGKGRYRVEHTSMFASPRPWPVPGVTVRPVEGGRARVVAVRRTRKIEDAQR